MVLFAGVFSLTRSPARRHVKTEDGADTHLLSGRRTIGPSTAREAG